MSHAGKERNGVKTPFNPGPNRRQRRAFLGHFGHKGSKPGYGKGCFGGC